MEHGVDAIARAPFQSPASSRIQAAARRRCCCACRPPGEVRLSLLAFLGILIRKLSDGPACWHPPSLNGQIVRWASPNNGSGFPFERML